MSLGQLGLSPLPVMAMVVMGLQELHVELHLSIYIADCSVYFCMQGHDPALVHLQLLSGQLELVVWLSLLQILQVELMDLLVPCDLHQIGEICIIECLFELADWSRWNVYLIRKRI